MLAASASAVSSRHTVDDVKARSEAVRNVLAQTFQTPGRAALVRMLPICGDTNALKVTVRCLYDPEKPVRDSAVDSLAEWPDRSAWDALLGVQKTPREPRYRAIAIRGLVRLGSEQNAKPDAAVIERYRQLLDGAKSDDDRKMVLGALAGCAVAFLVAYWDSITGWRALSFQWIGLLSVVADLAVAIPLSWLTTDRGRSRRPTNG